MNSSNVNKDLRLKAKDLDPKAKAKDSICQCQIFHRSFYIIFNVPPLLEKTLSIGAGLAGTARILSNKYPRDINSIWLQKSASLVSLSNNKELMVSM